MDTIELKKADLQDLTALQLIATETFVETFGESNNEEDMANYLEQSFNSENMAAQLNNPDATFFLALDGGNPVGYLKINTGSAQTEPQDNQALEIERIYVKSSHHGKKVGQLLFEKALDIAEKQKHSYIWLGVWEHNVRAIKFYEKNGFEAFDQHIFKMGDDEQTDIMMKKMITPI